jgi:putative hydrolase of the HAD superfamily
MYKNYIFDFYGTLAYLNTNEKKQYLWQKLNEYYGFYGAHYSPKEIREEYLRLCKLETEKLSGLDYPEIQLEYVFLELFRQKGIEAKMDLAINAGHLFRIISIKDLKLYDGVIDLLKSLKEANKNIYLLSNAQQIFTEYEMKLLNIYTYFDGIVFSSDEGRCKPDSNFYNALLDRYKLKKDESIMIGNDPIADIKGSYEVGLDSLYIHSNLSPQIKDKLLSKFTIMDGDFKKVRALILK